MSERFDTVVPEGADAPVPFVDAAGGRRILNCRPTAPERRMAFPRYADRVAPLPESEWVEFDDFASWSYPIKDQDGVGACMGHATATAFEFAYAMAYGRFRPFSAWFCYSRINGGRDAGATVGDAFASIRRDGICPEEMVPYGTWRPNRIPREAAEAALGFRAENIYRLESESDLATAVMLRHPVAYGTGVAGDFGRLDEEGVPVRVGGSGGHAMALFGGAKKVRRGRFAGRWAFKNINSWTRDWASGGTCWMTYAHVADSWGLDAFAIVVPTPSPDGEDRPPVIR